MNYPLSKCNINQDSKAIIHFLLTEDDMRQKTKSAGRFSKQALCGNGSYHSRKEKTGVTCPICLELIRIGKARSY